MTTLPAPRTRPRAGLRAALVARAVAAALIAVVTTFDQGHLDHPKQPELAVPFGLGVVGVLLPLLGLSLLVGLGSAQRGRRARVAVVLRAVVLVVVGVLALVVPVVVRGTSTSIVLLVVLESVALLAGGALELIGGLAPGEPRVQRRDAITMGGLQLVAGVMLAVIDADAVFAVGVLGAWAAITAVYLAIAAASVGRGGPR